MPITDLDRVKRALRIPVAVTVHDARITEICGEVDDELLQQFNLTSWDSATVYNDSLDILPGTTAQTVLLRRFPVSSVVALTASGASLVQNTDYRLDPGGVVRLIGTDNGFEVGRDTVRVSYTAGHVSAGATPAWLSRVGTLSAAKQYYVEAQAGISDLTIDPIRQVLARFDEDQAEREINKVLSRWRVQP